MKVGDLVTYWHQRTRWRKGGLAEVHLGTGPQSVHIGLIIETGKFTGNRDVKVLWTGSPEPLTECSQHLSLVDNSLTQP